jgi:hypothetical protein
MGSSKANWQMMEDANALVCIECNSVFTEGVIGEADVIEEDIGRCPFCDGALIWVAQDMDPTTREHVGRETITTFDYMDYGENVVTMPIVVTRVIDANKYRTMIYPATIGLMRDGRIMVEPNYEQPVFLRYTTSFDGALVYHGQIPKEALDALTMLTSDR